MTSINIFRDEVHFIRHTLIELGLKLPGLDPWSRGKLLDLSDDPARWDGRKLGRLFRIAGVPMPSFEF